MSEALDAVSESRPFAGVHILATAMLCAAGASADELELARRLLEKDPKDPSARETESSGDAFYRQMDAAIDACDRSRGEPTRAGRRARLAADLDRGGYLVVDRNFLAGLIADRISLELRACNTNGEDLGAELIDSGDPDVDRMDGGSGELEAYEIDGPYDAPGDYSNPSVND
jgi:hypothetical protein